MKRDLGALSAREHDVLVIGGGIHGAFAAWDAAQRGLLTALVEAEDFGAGTSWNSLKTIHGGLRYLQSLDLLRMRESIRERRTLLAIAPDLVRPLRFVVPSYGHGMKSRGILALALRVNDVVSADRNAGLPPAQRIGPGRSLSREELLRLVPGAPPAGLSGGAVWNDAQVESTERLLLGVLHAAAEEGTALANHARVLGVLRRDGRVAGVQLLDGLGGGSFEIRARLVLNAAGPGMDDVLATAGVRRAPVSLLRALNLVLNRPLAREHAIGALSAGRYLFLVPWRDRAMIGTDYLPAGAPADPGEACRFLEAAARAFPWAKLSAADVALVHRGRVPGLDAKRLAVRHVLLDHAAEGAPGLVSVQGVKYTTARAVAEEAVDLLCHKLGLTRPSRTAATRLRHARALEGDLIEKSRLAAREEMAMTLADAVLRRLDLGTASPAATAEVDTVALTLATELGWDRARVEAERQALADAVARSAL